MQYIQIQPQNSGDITTPSNGNVNVFLDTTENSLKGKDENSEIINLLPAPTTEPNDLIPAGFINKQKNFVWLNTFSFDKLFVDGVGDCYAQSFYSNFTTVNCNNLFFSYQNICSILYYQTAASSRTYTGVGILFSYLKPDITSIFSSYAGSPAFVGQNYFLSPDASGEVKVVINFFIDVLKTLAKEFDSTLTYTAPMTIDHLPSLVNYKNDYSTNFGSGGIFEDGVHSNRLSRLLLIFADFLIYYRDAEEDIITELGPSFLDPATGDNTTSYNNFANFIDYFSGNFS